MSIADSIRAHLPYTGRAPLPAGLKRAYRRWLVDEYHKYYYCSGAWQKTSWLGVPAKQCAEDLIVLQQIVWDTRPDLIVETGTFNGGTALFFATVFDAIGEGEVLTIDIDHSRVEERVREHTRVALLTADSTAPQTREEVGRRAEGRRVMLYLDADHSEQAVLTELRTYADLVSPGCYAVVADSNLNGHPVPWDATHGPWGEVPRAEANGPYEAIEAFLRERTDFEADASREYQLLTFNPGGFLRCR